MSARKLYATDESFREVADLLFGGGYEEVVAKAWTKEERQEFGRTVGQSTNALGAVAGPAALYSAVRHRKEGGIPRDVASSVGPKMARSKNPKVKAAGWKVNRAVRALNSPKGKNAKIAAGAAAGGLVGLQAVNWMGDTIPVTPGFRTPIKAKEEKKKVAKGYISKMNPEGHDLSTKGVKIPNKRDVMVTTGQKLEPHIRVQGGKLKKLAQEKVGKTETYDVTWEGEFSKVNSDKQQVFGWASIVEINGEPVVDLQGDYISIDEVEKSAYAYVHKSRKGGDMHLRDGDEPVHASDMIESFVVTPEKKQALNLPDETPTGWWVGFQVNDPEVWAKVKNGERTGFSIHGRGVRSPM